VKPLLLRGRHRGRARVNEGVRGHGGLGREAAVAGRGRGGAGVDFIKPFRPKFTDTAVSGQI
jgi:hypothetical protein